MKILVISDLHICDGGAFNTFGWEDDDFIARLELYREIYDIDSVILNGDIFEMYKYSYRQIYRHHSKLIDYFISSRCIFLRGNHDSAFTGSVDELTLVGGKGRLIHLEHGHKADFCGYTAVRALHRIAFRGLKLLAVLRSLHICARFLSARDEGFDRIKFRKKRYDSYAGSLLNSMYDVVITGHTHALESVEYPGRRGRKIFLNSGTCSQGRFQAVVLDTDSLEYFFIKDARKAPAAVPETSRALEAVG